MVRPTRLAPMAFLVAVVAGVVVLGTLDRDPVPTPGLVRIAPRPDASVTSGIAPASTATLPAPTDVPASLPPPASGPVVMPSPIPAPIPEVPSVPPPPAVPDDDEDDDEDDDDDDDE